MASIFSLPVVFVCENNQYASTTPASYALSVANVADRAAAYNMPGVIIEGDVVSVYCATLAAVARAREGKGPTLIEAKTYRWAGHFVGDPERYRSHDEVEAAKQRDPIHLLKTQLTALERGSPEEIERHWQEAQAEIDDAVRYAEASPLPSPEEALEDLYVSV